MLIGYARGSTSDQKLHSQRAALRAAGCEQVFEEKHSASRGPLPAREKLLAFARSGDVLVVWRLDRLGRSLRDLVELVADLDKRGVELRSLRESLDTTTPAGKLTFHIFAALAEMEAEILRERTRAGLDSARRRGKRLGRPRVLSPDQVEMARTLMANPALSAAMVAHQLGVHRSTLYRNLNPATDRADSRP
jgi:DNA invertase Pin-like site-specific DNA recombinase